MNYKEIKAFQYKNGFMKQINEKLIKEELLKININNIHIENVLTIAENIELLSIGYYFHHINVSPEYILKNITITGNMTNLNLELFNLTNETIENRYLDFMNTENKKNKIRLNQNEVVLYPEIIFKIKRIFENMSQLFKETAGVHSASIFDDDGNNIGFFIDISRLNCLRKVTGFLIKNNEQTINKRLCIMISSRVNTDIIKMFDKLGISTLITKAAPSYDSIIKSEMRNITLIGFLKDDRFTVFCGNQRVITQ